MTVKRAPGIQQRPRKCRIRRFTCSWAVLFDKIVVVLLLLLAFVGCADDELVSDQSAIPVPVSWPSAGSFPLSPSLAESYPVALARVSRWVTHVRGPVDERPDIGHRGSYGVGNGHVFGFVGLADPLNTLHSLVGPSYEKKERFFGDYSVSLRLPGESKTAEFDEEWASRSLSAPVLVTSGIVGNLRLDTLDFAPASDDPTLRSCFVRLLVVSNGGPRDINGLDLVVEAHQSLASDSNGVAVERTKERSLVSGFVGSAAVVNERSFALQLPNLPPGGSQRRVLLHCTSESTTPVSSLPVVDVDQLLGATVDAYRSWSAPLLRVQTPDPMVDDFIEGMKMTLRVQTAATGASCPMSEYTRTWARDNIGPTLGLLDLGAFDDVRAMMDYVYGAVLLRGDLANSYDADLDLSHLPASPDWQNMPPLEGRVAAETPSYMVWIYGDYYTRTGDLGPAEQRYGFLRRCLWDQAFSQHDLLPFTGDETFRPAMDFAFGLSANYAYEKKSWSTNSSLLWLGAQRRFVRLAEALGRSDDVARTLSRTKDVEKAVLGTYRLEDGCLSPFADRDTGEVWPVPFEDVSLKVVWAGWKRGSEPIARETIECLRRRLEVSPGVYVTPKNPEGKSAYLLGKKKGIYTGMLPAYTLYALSDTGHAHASEAFNWLGRSLDPSGNCVEDVVLDDDSSLSLIYDQEGLIGDYTAKFRPWEGGIALDAILQYLLGFEHDAPSRLLRFRPHLPVNWPGMKFEHVRVGSGLFDIDVERIGGRVNCRVVSHASEEFHVSYSWDRPQAASLTTLRVQGVDVAADEVQTEQWGGIVRSTLARPVVLPAGGVLVFD